MDVKRPKPKPQRTALGTSRVRVFLAGFLVSGVASVAAGQPPANTPRRAAILLAPEPFQPGEGPTVARGAVDDSSPVVTGSTPATRPGGKAPPPGSPVWLNGIDPNVVPAGVAPSPTPAAVRPFPPTPRPWTAAAAPATDPAPAPKGGDRWKGFVGAEQPGGGDPRTPTDPNAPLRGVAANGAPVLAGPPAYRWYGYGSVTPGANPYAPAGQYPRASGNWYSVTGATPGAFPVPVMNPYRPAPGSEAPAYAAAPGVRPGIAPVNPQGLVAGDPAGIPFTPGRGAGQPVSGPTTVPPPKFNPTPPPVTTPKPDPITPGGQSLRPASMPGPGQAVGPVGGTARVLIPPPVGVPTIVSPPLMTSTSVLPLPPPEGIPPAPVAAIPPPVTAVPEPEGRRPAPVVTPTAGPALSAIKLPGPVTPSPLPLSVTDEIQWRTNPDRAVPVPPGTWVPVTDTPRNPGPPADDNTREPGATETVRARPVARAQVADTDRQPDPAVALVQGLCRGRADGVEVRWTGSKRLAVCFEVGSAREAAALVKDISARRELAPLQIDFAVFVK
ncbi:MAG: hypothetical protein JWO38_210 [Gemmataceae bacterium]|nr:hypothetical protein [Gemmataceae bacterium]